MRYLRYAVWPMLFLSAAYSEGLLSRNLSASRVLRVVDGDTVVLQRGGQRVTCRLIGVDTPETVAPGRPVEFYGPEASAYLKSWIEGKVVRVDYEHIPYRKDRYGRPLVYLFADRGRQVVNVELVRRGFGRYEPQYKSRYASEFVVAEAQAKIQGLGVWSRP